MYVNGGGSYRRGRSCSVKKGWYGNSRRVRGQGVGDLRKELEKSVDATTQTR